MPKENNNFMFYYPGDKYVDFIGLDGYNWGNTKTWSRWRSFKEIFEGRLRELENITAKPVIISEFSSTSSGGDKALWIKEAFRCIEKHKNIAAFVLFNVDKETDWSFAPDTEWGEELRIQMKSGYFKDNAGLPE
ncbi:MAG: hypothetical protein JW946_01230 [Candidatus Omnitrophica bacterium]|nr:hypothetical protein [Candidatus Omnitrophota bacterium]